MTKLKAYRQKSGLTQVQVAIRVGCSLTSYTHWEMGVTTPSKENYEKLKEVLGIKDDESDERGIGKEY